MSPANVFHVSIYALVCQAALMLALAEGAFFPVALTLPLAVFTFVFVDRHGRFVASIAKAGGLGLAAFALAVAEFLGEDIEEQLLSGAHLLVYFTWITLLMRKHLPTLGA